MAKSFLGFRHHHRPKRHKFERELLQEATAIIIPIPSSSSPNETMTPMSRIKRVVVVLVVVGTDGGPASGGGGGGTLTHFLSR